MIRLTLACLLLLAAPAGAQSVPETEEGKTLYFLGTVVARQALGDYGLTESEGAQVEAGIRDQLRGVAPELDQSVYVPRVQALLQERRTVLVQAEAKASGAWVEEQAKREGAVRTDSGVVVIEQSAGAGPSPTAESTVRVHYHGQLRDGTVFDSSVERGQPFQTSLQRVIPCWTEGMQSMKVGGKAVLVCPSELAYGERGAPPAIPGGAALSFEVELIEIVE